jgi:adenylate kinase
MFREHRAKQTEIGKIVGPILLNGGLVSDDIVTRMIAERLQEKDAAQGALFDGFPRTIAQASQLDLLLGRSGACVSDAVLLELPDDLVVERISGRCTDKATGRTYHIRYNPPPHGADLVYREDDREEKVRARLVAYHNETMPIIPFYEAQAKLRRVDGTGEVNDIFNRVLKAIGAQ